MEVAETNTRQREWLSQRQEARCKMYANTSY